MTNKARLPLYSFFLLPPIGQLRADPVDTGQMQPTPMGEVGSGRCGPVGTPAGELPVVLGLDARVAHGHRKQAPRAEYGLAT